MRKSDPDDLKAGDSIRIGLIGPIPIVDPDDPRRVAAIAAAKVAQAAITLEDLRALVLSHSNPITRAEAIPRLKARFPDDSQAHVALLKAIKDADDGVRCAAISAVADLGLSPAADLLVEALSDPERDVRFFAAIGLQTLG
ncbi:MAG: HEAT repeat domain-containing protein, partial [bacterium]